MEATIRFIIDYRTGKTWEMPAELYEIYETYCQQLEDEHKPSLTNPDVHEQWFSTLSKEDQAKIIKR
jgi:hypothetical protein